MSDFPTRHWIPAMREEDGAHVMLWEGAGAIANDLGDIYGTSPHRITRWGRMSIEEGRLEAALAHGWRFVPGADEGFARIERTAADRAARE